VHLPRSDARLGGVAEDRDGLAVGVAGRLDAGTAVVDVLDACRTAGPSAVHELPGEWIVAVREASTLTVLRDAAGVRTAYWTVHDGRFVLAVEPKGALALPGVPRDLDAGAVAQFLAFSFVPGERCTLRDLREVPAGHQVEVDLATGAVRVVRWFCHEDVEPDDDPDECRHVAAVRHAVDRAVTRRVPTGQPVAAFLSGGLDSSVVVAAAAEVRRARGDDPLVALSLHFGQDLPNEVPFARAVAARAVVEHRVVEVTDRALLPMLRRMVWHLDDPIGDPVTIGNFALAEAAAGIAPWVLNGEGGDPLFGGPKNLPMLLAHWYPSMVSGEREAAYLATWRRAGEEIGTLLHPDLRREVDYERDVLDVVRPYFSAVKPVHFLNKLMVANMRLKGAHLILPKVDRLLGAYALTPLSPLFDVDVLRTSLRTPPRLKLRNGVEKWVLKRAYENALPREVVDRPKSGMRVPVHWWFRGELRREAKAMLSPRAVRRAGVFDPARVRDILRYRTGRDGLRLWMLLTFELWRRMVIEGEAP
jgi:asparagine synthase (glutamine-hydrolysing)